MSSSRTYPPTQPHRIMTSPGRSQTEPAHNGFMKSVMRHHDMDVMDEGIMVMSQPEEKGSSNFVLVNDLAQPKKKITQKEQDAEDQKARKRAMRNLVNSWQERLQLISVITTFFASTEAAMLVNTKPANPGDLANNTLQASNACLLGALIVHVYAAVLSFLGAFLLIRYKLKEATREELKVEGITLATSPLGGYIINDIEQDAVDLAQQQTLTNQDVQSTVYKSANYGTTASDANQRNVSIPLELPIVSTDPHLEQVVLFKSKVPSNLLSRTHALCVLLAAVGFVLAIAGILCYAWALQPIAVSIFASVCLGVSVLSMAALLI